MVGKDSGVINGYVNAYSNVVPAARALIAKELCKHGINEETAAGLLGVTQASISKYVTSKYSDAIKATEAKIDRSIIDIYIQNMIAGKKEYISACICAICRSLNDFDCKVSSTI